MIVNPSPMIARGVGAATPVAVMVGLYLLFAGHNRPGGGFAAGLVFGAVVTLRAIAGLPRPSDASRLIALGVLLVAVVAVVPVVLGQPLLDQAVGSIELPVLGKVKSGSALPFDVGVTAIVVGLVVALIEGLAAEEFGPVSGSSGNTDAGNTDAGNRGGEQ